MTEETIQPEEDEPVAVGPTGCKCGCETAGDHDECDEECSA